MRKQGQSGYPLKTGNPPTLHDTMKGDHHKDKPLGQYKAKSRNGGMWAGVFGGEGSVPVKPAFRKGGR